MNFWEYKHSVWGNHLLWLRPVSEGLCALPVLKEFCEWAGVGGTILYDLEMRKLRLNRLDNLPKVTQIQEPLSRYSFTDITMNGFTVPEHNT